MTKVTKSAIINMSIENVWAQIRDFSKMSVWHPIVADSSVDLANENSLGAIRTCSLEGGGIVKEALTDHNDEEKRFSYDFLESPMPMTNAATKVQLKPITETGQTFIEWIMEFEPDQGAEKDLIEMTSGMILAGFSSLQAKVSQ